MTWLLVSRSNPFLIICALLSWLLNSKKALSFFYCLSFLFELFKNLKSCYSSTFARLRVLDLEFRGKKLLSKPRIWEFRELWIEILRGLSVQEKNLYIERFFSTIIKTTTGKCISALKEDSFLRKNLIKHAFYIEHQNMYTENAETCKS